MSRKNIVLVGIFFGVLMTGLLAGYASEKFIYPDNMGRDPFSPLIDKNGVLNVQLIRKHDDLALNGIIYSQEAEERIAVINKEPFRIGDYVGNYKVSQINLTEVVVAKDGEETILTMEVDNEE